MGKKHRLITSKHIKKDGTTSKQEFKHDNYIGKPEITHDHDRPSQTEQLLYIPCEAKDLLLKRNDKNKIRVTRRLVKNKKQYNK